MTMGFLLNDIYSESEPADAPILFPVSPSINVVSRSLSESWVRERQRIPDVGNTLARERVLDLLDRSTLQYGATLISGRAGTGKTTLAANFAMRQAAASWCTLEPSDADWVEFSQIFRSSISGKRLAPPGREAIFPTEAVISEFVAECFVDLLGTRSPHLIVLDNIHHLFDTGWFTDLFRQLILSLGETARLVMLCRGRPSAPLWRLRSKQMLNVIDEELLALNQEEAIDICEMRGISIEWAASALKLSHGRVGTFMDLLPDSD
jgi:ATP/maltotriose-dependent transcriptional regulator MalT